MENKKSLEERAEGYCNGISKILGLGRYCNHLGISKRRLVIGALMSSSGAVGFFYNIGTFVKNPDEKPEYLLYGILSYGVWLVGSALVLGKKYPTLFLK